MDLAILFLILGVGLMLAATFWPRRKISKEQHHRMMAKLDRIGELMNERHGSKGESCQK